jgi:hypothetical protein
MGCSVFFGCTSLKSVKKIGNTKILYFGELAKICELVGNPWNFSSELPFGCELVSKQRSTSAKPKAQKKAATKSQGSDSEANAFDNLKCETLATGSLKLLAYLDRSVKKVVLPESITEIRSGAFENCTELSDIELPSTLIYIGVYAFAKCSSLHTITIPRSVDNIDSGAFEGCRNISFVMLGYNLEKIGKRCFYGCSNLKAVSVPDNVKEIDDEAFSGCNIQVLTLGRGLKRIGDRSFESASGAVTVPESVERVGAYAFAYVQSVTLEHKRWKAAGKHVPVEIVNDPKLLARCLSSGKIGKRYNKTGLDKVK